MTIDQKYDLLYTAPDTSLGAPIGPRGAKTDWAVVVEVFVPTEQNSRWQTAAPLTTWATDTDEGVWSTWEWIDLTDDVRSVDWERGSVIPGGRPRIGQATIVIDNEDYRWSPWNANSTSGVLNRFDLGSNHLVRISLVNPNETAGGDSWDSSWYDTGWWPQFTGVVESWNDIPAVHGLVPRIEIKALDTLTLLARSELVQFDTPVKYGENYDFRSTWILEQAGWQYGIDYTASLTTTALSWSNFGTNPLAELYRTFDSFPGCYLFSSPVGTAWVKVCAAMANIGTDEGYPSYYFGDPFDPGGPWPVLTNLPNPPAETGYEFVRYSDITIPNDDNGVISEVNVAVTEFPGGNERTVTYRNRETVARYGVRTASIDGLCTDVDEAEDAALRLLEYRAGTRIQGLTLTSNLGLDQVWMQLQLGPLDPIYVDWAAPGIALRSRYLCRVSRIHHTITPSVGWTTTMDLAVLSETQTAIV
jgi:hypothetical protein